MLRNSVDSEVARRRLGKGPFVSLLIKSLVLDKHSKMEVLELLADFSYVELLQKVVFWGEVDAGFFEEGFIGLVIHREHPV